MSDGPFFFFDTSAVVKYYDPAEKGHSLVVNISSSGSSCYIADITVVEAVKVFREKRNRALEKTRKRVYKDLVRAGYENTVELWKRQLNNLWLVAGSPADVAQEGLRLIHTYDGVPGCSMTDASDAYILATAIVLKKRLNHLSFVFVSGDESTRLNEAARREGFDVVDPNVYPHNSYLGTNNHEQEESS